MSWLEGSNFQQETIDEKANVKEDYETLCREFPDFKEKYTYEYFAEQVYLVHSRNFIATIDDVETNI